jgi:hypothetical protein
VLASGILTTTYTVTSLIPGVTYQFNVQSRNSYGLSNSSASLSLLCAWVPNPPILSNDNTTTSDTVIRITWVNGSNDGSEILDYTVYYD